MNMKGIELNMTTDEKHTKLQKDISSAVMRANFHYHISTLIRDLFSEYVESYSEIPLEEITAMMICETINEINTTAHHYR